MSLATFLAACGALLITFQAPFTAASQAPVARDTVRLATLQAQATAHDPRNRQRVLLAAQSELRLRNLNAERLPAFGVNGQAQYQSAVATIPLALPGVVLPSPPHDTYDASANVRQRLYDPTLQPRRELELARLAETESRLEVTLYTVRQLVNDAYFAALTQQTQEEALQIGVMDLEGQHRVAVERVREGTALPSEAAMLEAELLRRRQALSELDANRRAALTTLADLTGRSSVTADILETPDLSQQVAAARAAFDSMRARPEFAQFARARATYERQKAASQAGEQPRVSAFSRAGYGRPGLNPLAREFTAYWLAGVQLEWNPFTWGATRRDRETLDVQQQIVATEEAAFGDALRRGVVRDLANLDRLEGTLVMDDSIIAIREAVLNETRLRFAEGVITSADYIARESDLLAARLARAAHVVELAGTRARYLTLVGVEAR